MRERPDVVAELAPGLARVLCPFCAAEATIEAPLLLIRPGNQLWFLLAVPVDELNGSVPSSAPALAEEARQALHMPQRRFMAPIIPIARLILPLALTRDIAHDLVEPDAAYQSLHASQPAVEDLYFSFLDVVRRSEPERRAAAILAAFWSVDPTRLVEFLDNVPELASPAVFDYAAADVAAEPDGSEEGPLHIRQRLLENLRSGMPTADVAHAYFTDLAPLGGALREEVERLRVQSAEKQGAEGIELLYKAVDLLPAGADQALEAAMCAELGQRLAADRSAGVDALEEAIRLLSRSLALIPEHEPDWARVAGNLASAYGRRVLGDRKQNWNTAHGLLQRASLVDRRAEPRSWSIIQTNLGLLYADRPGRQPQDLDRGIEHVRAGMLERSPADNITDWAYSLVNLGVLYQRRGGDMDLRMARDGYRRALEHLRPVDDLPLWATLQYDLADVLLTIQPSDLDGAERAARAALAHVQGRGEGYGEARLTWVLAKVAYQRGGNRAADGIEMRAEALRLAEPKIFPALHVRIAAEQAGEYAKLDDWHAAADLYSSALAALDVLYDAQTSPDGRQDVLGLVHNLSRWAAFALAHAGRPEQAVESLERSRARQLATAVGRDTADLSHLVTIDPHLAERYRSARAHHRNVLAAQTGLAADGDAEGIGVAERALHECIEEIRSVPGLHDFLRPVSLAAIAQIADGLPLIYLVSSPTGSYMLAACQGALGSPIVESTFVPTVTSMTVYSVVVFEHQGESAPGLLLAQASSVLDRQRLLTTALQRLDLLRPLITPVARLVADHPSRAAVIVPTGLLGLVPLHAVTVDPAAGEVLDDVGDIYLAPSAALYAASRSRAQQTRTPHLVAIADPDGSLPGGRAEVATIRTYFEPEGNVSVEQGNDATDTWLIEHLSMASHLHLSCHGYSNFNDRTGGTLNLGSGTRLTVGTMLNGRLPLCRLAVASACQSGHYSLSDNPDEFTGLAAAFLRAGAACAVVSLWQVDDWATALLMTRFYELLAPTRPDGGMHPVPALRQARLWLRRLTGQQIADYVNAHPQLADIRIAVPGSIDTGDNPYASPRHWSAFTSWGC